MYLRPGPYPHFTKDNGVGIQSSKVSDQNKLADLFISIAFLAIVVSSLIPCLGFVKRSLRCVFGSKPKKTVRSGSAMSSDSSGTTGTTKHPAFKDYSSLLNHLGYLIEDEGERLTAEFEELKIEENPTTAAADLPVNRSKNRFANILPYDSTRVILKPLPNVDGSDYINANFIQGVKSPKEYIATQGPLKSTVHDFWRMCWETDTRAIIMLTKCIDSDKEKCYKYWPSGSLPEEYDEFEVEVVNESTTIESEHQWVTRDMIFRKGDEERSLKHFHFLTWPDFGAVFPDTALTQFIIDVRTVVQCYSQPTSHCQPIVVHCSAGVGRSGTFIAIDMCMQQITSNEEINVFATVSKLRHQRVWMVQTVHQYLSVYSVLLDYWKVFHRSQRKFRSAQMSPSQQDDDDDDKSERGQDDF